MTKLHEIRDFGKIEAESDDLLHASFEHHPAIDQILTNNKILILGRKGSGKTAIYRQLMTPSPDHFFDGHSFVDYPWNHHDKQVVPDAVDQERYLHSWKYLILISVAKIIVNDDESIPCSPESRPAVNDLRNFLVECYGSTQPKLADTFAPNKKIGFIDRMSIDLKLFKIEPASATMQQMPLVIQDLNRKLQELLLQAVNPDHTYIVAFDELDRGFDPNDAKYTQRLIGLLLAARDIVRASSMNGSLIRPVVFLRSDIYHQNLDFEDKNKLTDTYGFEIEWEVRGAPKLKDLMERRFRVRLNSEKIKWDDVFDETREMAGRQSKYAHILSRTLHRPRDVIKFCNCILNAHHHRCKHVNSDDAKFTNEDVNSAREEYSKHFRRELEDENFKSEPDFKLWIQALRDVEAQEFSRQEYEKALQARHITIVDAHSVQRVLASLYELSVVGYLRIGGREGGSKFVFKYLEPDKDMNPRATDFKVHSGLLDDLGIKKFVRS